MQPKVKSIVGSLVRLPVCFVAAVTIVVSILETPVKRPRGR
jgi:hypothetical protein